MGPTEFFRTVHPERVVPNHPAAAVEADFSALDLKFCSEVVTYRQPECAGRFQHAMDLADPRSAPITIRIRVLPIVVGIVLITDIERRVGEHQVDRPRFDLPH